MAPANSAAWFETKDSTTAEVKEAAYPSAGPDEIVVKNAAIAINPVDWKLQVHDFIGLTYPVILGEDVAGEVVDVGSDVSEFKVGDHVLGTKRLTGNRHGLGLVSRDPKHGGFQLYTVLSAAATSKKPANVSFEDASVLPLAVSTAAAGLFEDAFLALPFPTSPPRAPSGQVVIVWGGSSSVGAIAIQLAKAAGVEVVTTASPRNFGLLKELGASETFDYSSKTVVDDVVKAVAGKKVAGIYEAISTADSQALAGKVAQQLKVQVALTLPQEAQSIPDGIKVSSVFAVTIFNNKVGPAVWKDFLAPALERGEFKPAPPAKIIGHGLEHVQAAMDANRKGLSAQKAVVTLG